MVWRGVAWRSVAWCDVVWCGVAWRGVAWRGVAWRGGARCDVVGLFQPRYPKKENRSQSSLPMMNDTALG